ncbi:hypothetical protein KAR48_11840 [bacterium]|nr:hypothetical protein [bacterium]
MELLFEKKNNSQKMIYQAESGATKHDIHFLTGNSPDNSSSIHRFKLLSSLLFLLILCSCKLHWQQQGSWSVGLEQQKGILKIRHDLWGSVADLTFTSHGEQGRVLDGEWRKSSIPHGWLIYAPLKEEPACTVLIASDSLKFRSLNRSISISFEGRLSDTQRPIRLFSPEDSVMHVSLGWTDLRAANALWDESGRIMCQLPGIVEMNPSGEDAAWNFRIPSGADTQCCFIINNGDHRIHTSSWRLHALPGNWRNVLTEVAALGRYAAPWGLDHAVIDMVSDSLRSAQVSVLTQDGPWEMVAKTIHEMGMSPVFWISDSMQTLHTDIIQHIMQAWNSTVINIPPSLVIDSTVTEERIQYQLTRLALTGADVNIDTRLGSVDYNHLGMARRIWPVLPVVSGVAGSEDNGQAQIIHLPLGSASIVAFFNDLDTEVAGSFDLQKLNISEENEYWIFDLWRYQLMGKVQQAVCTDIPAGGCRLFLTLPMLDRPQFLCSNRHLTTVFGDDDIRWNRRSFRLSGKTIAWPGESRRIYMVIPPGWIVDDANADGNVVYSKRTGPLLELCLKVEKGNRQRWIKWEICFVKASEEYFS